jgi:hypothetical protein
LLVAVFCAIEAVDNWREAGRAPAFGA